MAMYGAGDSVRWRTAIEHQIVGGTVLRVKRKLLPFWGVKYLVQYRVHDLDFDYHYNATKWLGEWRLF